MEGPKTSDTPRMLLASALVKAQSLVKAACNSTENKFDHYWYSTLNDYYDVLRPVLAECKLATVFEQDQLIPMEARTTSGGKTEYVVRVKLKATVIHESGESIVVYGFGEGQDRGDKSLYKAITGAKKYLLSSIYGIPTTDDPELDSHEGAPTPTKPSPNAQKQASKPPTMQPPTQVPPPPKAPSRPTDIAQRAKGLILGKDLDSMVALLASKGIPKEKFSEWLLEHYKYKTPWGIRGGKEFSDIMEHIEKYPEAIYKAPEQAPTQPAREPGSDD